MRLLAILILALIPARAEDGGTSLAPTYSAASIVNAATNLADALAPNTIVTVYGENLSYESRGIAASDISGGVLPTVLAGTGVWVLIGNFPAHVYYVSPRQVNFLVPNDVVPGNTTLRIIRQGLAGPPVRIRLRTVAPALFQMDVLTPIAARPDGSVATADDPARPGDVIILYATGLGATEPQFPPGFIPNKAAELTAIADLTVLLDSAAVRPADILYAGVAPGFAGLYQINLRLPASVGDDPEIRIVLGGEASPPGLRIPVRR